MGGLFGGGTQQTSQTVNNTPWAAQQPYELQGFQNAQQTYANDQAIGPFSGQITAPGGALNANAENYAGLYTNGQGAQMPGAVNGTSLDLMSGAPQFEQTAENLSANGIGGPNAGLYGTLEGYGTGAQTTQGPSAGLSSALNSAAVTGANSLNGFNSGLSSVANEATSDPTARIAADASTYANNPGTQAAIKSTNAQLQQTLNEQTVPQLNREAAMGGALNSSRAGMAEAQANENEGIVQGNADAQILNNAENTGMATAAGLYSGGLNTAANANTAGLTANGNLALGTGNQQTGVNEFNTNTELNAANSGLSNQLGFEEGNANTQLGANAQLGSGIGTGVNAATAGGNLAAGNFGLGAEAGGLQQSDQQAADTNALQQWQMQTQYPYQNLDNYWGVVGNPLGTTSQSTGTVSNSGPGVAGGILGLGLGAAGLFGSGGAFPGVGRTIGGLFG